MGKSASMKLLCARGVEVVDTDDLARKVVEPGEPALGRIRDVFGADMISAEGTLRRDQLAKRVFASDDARRKLEEILHPPIRALWRAQVASWRNEGQSLCVVVIPLLFETNADQEFDAIVCVACSAPTQKARLAERGWSVGEVERRIGAQLPLTTKIARSDYVVWTEGDMTIHAEQLTRVIRTIDPGWLQTARA